MAAKIKNIRAIVLISLILSISLEIHSDVYQEYIDKFYEMAIEQQQEFGIPASITLAQGILESSAGRSTLATQGNNHFGIKCHKEWSGATMYRDDDAPNECFRVYNSAAESYRDHSLFLKRKRYNPLFELEVTDYKGWATGLKSCGYATDPNYAARIITIIERYALYNYDNPSLEPDENAEFIQDQLASTHRIRKNHGLYYVVALPGDTYKSISKEFNIKEKTLRSFNDAPKNGKIEEWEEIYLQPKMEMVEENVSEATIGDGETMRTVSQRYGITLEALKRMNSKAKDHPGTVLRLK